MDDEPPITVKPASETIYAFGSPTIEIGDTFTMFVAPHLSWWPRLLVRVGLRRKPQPALRSFKVTHST